MPRAPALARAPPGPRLVAAIDAAFRRRMELGVLDMEDGDARMVDIDEAEIVELLQHEVAGVVEDLAARVIADAGEEPLEGDAVMEILAGMDLVAEIDPGLVEGIQNWRPPRGELVERGLDEAGGTLRPRVEIGPGERAGKRRMRREPEMARGAGRLHQLVDRPGLARRGVAAH